MKHAKKHIPTPPSAPSAPGTPSAPNASNIPSGGSGSAAPPPMSGMQGFSAMEQIMKHITTDRAGSMDIEKIMKDFDVDQYRDENGKITCPVSKEDRQALMDSLK